MSWKRLLSAESCCAPATFSPTCFGFSFQIQGDIDQVMSLSNDIDQVMSHPTAAFERPDHSNDYVARHPRYPATVTDFHSN